MAYNSLAVPQWLGNVVVASPGTPVQITNVLQATSNGSGNIVGSATDPVLCNQVNINASPITHTGAGNTGKIYFGTKNMVRATLVGVYAVISPGQGFQMTNNVALNIFDANQLYLDADTAGDAGYGSIVTV